MTMRENGAIGEESEHLLVGSTAWLEAQERAATARGKGFGVNGAIAREIAKAEDAEVEREMQVWAFERSTGHMETDTGKQVHPSLINHLEATTAIGRLASHSASQCRRYRMFEFAGMTVAEIAVEEGESEYTIEKSLQAARRFLRHLILDRVA